jgi:hypothetical protein
MRRRRCDCMHFQLCSAHCSSPRGSRMRWTADSLKMSQMTSEPGSRVSAARMVGLVAMSPMGIGPSTTCVPGVTGYLSMGSGGEYRKGRSSVTQVTRSGKPLSGMSVFAGTSRSVALFPPMQASQRGECAHVVDMVVRLQNLPAASNDSLSAVSLLWFGCNFASRLDRHPVVVGSGRSELLGKLTRLAESLHCILG